MTINNSDISWLIIDWGTTNFRAFAMDAQAKVIDQKQCKLGLLQVAVGDFADQLEKVLQGWLNDYQSLPIYMAGMVGSKQGWFDVPYTQTPISIDNLADKAYRFTLPWGATATICPGVSHYIQPDQYDVMRGEEIQLVGLAQHCNQQRYLAVLPGTHSKHAFIEQGQVTQFSTFMTGELYSALSQHTILGRGLPSQVTPTNNIAFYRGIKESQAEHLTNLLFLARTHRLFSNIADNEVLDYLSGLLIGKELKALKHTQACPTIYLVGDQALCQRYQLACNALDIPSEIVLGDHCFISGMTAFEQRLNQAVELA